MAKFKILKEGETDIDSTDIWRFAFHSDYPTFKIASGGSQEITLSSGNTEASHTIYHGLGYYPTFFAGIKYGSYYFPIQGYGIDFAITGLIDEYGDPMSIITYAFPYDSNNIRIGVESVPYASGYDYQFTAYWTIMLDEN